MLYSRASQLALQAMFFLAGLPPQSSRRVQDIALALGVSASYLAKVLQSLTRVGLLRAARGPSGGISLGRPAQEITLWDVLTAVGSVSPFEQCVLGLGHCNDQRPCPVHSEWMCIRLQILEMMQKKSLWEFATEAQGKQERNLPEETMAGSGVEAPVVSPLGVPRLRSPEKGHGQKGAAR